MIPRNNAPRNFFTCFLSALLVLLTATGPCFALRAGMEGVETELRQTLNPSKAAAGQEEITEERAADQLHDALPTLNYEDWPEIYRELVAGALGPHLPLIPDKSVYDVETSGISRWISSRGEDRQDALNRLRWREARLFTIHWPEELTKSAVRRHVLPRSPDVVKGILSNWLNGSNLDLAQPFYQEDGMVPVILIPVQSTPTSQRGDRYYTGFRHEGEDVVLLQRRVPFAALVAPLHEEDANAITRIPLVSDEDRIRYWDQAGDFTAQEAGEYLYRDIWGIAPDESSSVTLDQATLLLRLGIEAIPMADLIETADELNRSAFQEAARQLTEQIHTSEFVSRIEHALAVAVRFLNAPLPSQRREMQWQDNLNTIKQIINRMEQFEEDLRQVEGTHSLRSLMHRAFQIDPVLFVDLSATLLRSRDLVSSLDRMERRLDIYYETNSRKGSAILARVHDLQFNFGQTLRNYKDYLSRPAVGGMEESRESEEQPGGQVEETSDGWAGQFTVQQFRDQFSPFARTISNIPADPMKPDDLSLLDTTSAVVMAVTPIPDFDITRTSMQTVTIYYAAQKGSLLSSEIRDKFLSASVEGFRFEFVPVTDSTTTFNHPAVFLKMGGSDQGLVPPNLMPEINLQQMQTLPPAAIAAASVLPLGEAKYFLELVSEQAGEVVPFVFTTQRDIVFVFV